MLPDALRVVALGGDLRLLLRDLFANGELTAARLQSWPERFGNIERAFSGIDLLLSRGDGGLLRVSSGDRLLTLALCDCAIFREFCVRVAIEGGNFHGALLLRELSLGGGEIAFGLRDAAIGIDLRLLELKIVLAQLFFEDGDLLLREGDARIGFGD